MRQGIEVIALSGVIAPLIAGGAGWVGMVFGPPRVYPPLPWPLWVVVQALEWVFVVYTVYTIALPVAGLWTRQIRERYTPQKRFAVVIPAHNESVVVANLLDSCHALDYPSELVDLYVIADNCTDNTAAIAASGGATVIERHNSAERGKGYALDYAFRWIHARKKPYDAFVIFDADNLVDPDFLNVMNAHLIRGDEVIQGRMDVKNPTDTWVSATFALSVWFTNRFWFLSKYNLGFSSVLGGTGMCISSALVQEIGWGATTFTEDLEFTMKALSRGIKTAWAHNAICYDEKVQTFAASWTQRKRWVQGQTSVAGSYLFSMGWKGIAQGNRLYIEAMFQLFQPFYLVLGTGLLLLDYLVPSVPLRDPVMRHLDAMNFWVVVAAVEYVLPVLAVLIDHAPKRALLFLPLYGVFVNSWIPLTWAGIVGPRPKHWTHTRHTRSMAYSDLLALRTERR